MEVRIDINHKVVAWLASMGYPVAGMPGAILRKMLLHEARQWQIAPEALSAMIDEGAGHAGRGAANDVRSLTRDAQPLRRPHDRLIGLRY